MAQPTPHAGAARAALAAALVAALAACSDDDEPEPAESEADPDPEEETSGASEDERRPPLEELAAEAEARWREAMGSPKAYIPELSVYIPDEERATDALWIAAVHDGERIRVEFRYQTDHPSWYHQYWIYDGEDWRLYGDADAGPQELGLYEDRFSWMLDDGSVEGFRKWGGYTTMHRGIRSRTDAADAEEVSEHPWLGDELGRDDVRKFLTASRQGGAEERDLWRRVRSPEELASLRREGVFLDSLQWRAHRGAPIGYADNASILDSRTPAEGKGMFVDNGEPEGDGPAWMYDPEETGKRSLRAEELLRREYDQGDRYYLAEEFAAEFDPDHEWEEGDAIPQRLLRQPSGSRGAAEAEGQWKDGVWRVAIERDLEAESELDSKSLEPGETYEAAFAVHTGATGGRWHYATMPLGFALDDVREIEEAHGGEGEGREDDEDGEGEESAAGDGDASQEVEDEEEGDDASGDAGREGGDGAASGEEGNERGADQRVIEVTYVGDGELESPSLEAFTRAPVFYPGQVFLGWLVDNGHPVHERYREAQGAPLDGDAVAAFAEALVEHELEFVRELEREDAAERASEGAEAQ